MHIAGGTNPVICLNRPSMSLCRGCLATFAGKLMFGRVGATSATEIPMLPFTGVARKAWMLPASGPLSTIAMPEICPPSLISLAHGCKEVGTGREQRVEVGRGSDATPLPPQPDIQVS